MAVNLIPMFKDGAQQGQYSTNEDLETQKKLAEYLLKTRPQGKHYLHNAATMVDRMNAAMKRQKIKQEEMRRQQGQQKIFGGLLNGLMSKGGGKIDAGNVDAGNVTPPPQKVISPPPGKMMNPPADKTDMPPVEQPQKMAPFEFSGEKLPDVTDLEAREERMLANGIKPDNVKPFTVEMVKPKQVMDNPPPGIKEPVTGLKKTPPPVPDLPDLYRQAHRADMDAIMGKSFGKLPPQVTPEKINALIASRDMQGGANPPLTASPQGQDFITKTLAAREHANAKRGIISPAQAALPPKQPAIKPEITPDAMNAPQGFKYAEQLKDPSMGLAEDINPAIGLSTLEGMTPEGFIDPSKKPNFGGKGVDLVHPKGRDPYANYMKGMRQLESSGGKLTAKNPNSSAYGPDQFIKSTWLDMLANHGGEFSPELGQLAGSIKRTKSGKYIVPDAKARQQIFSLRANDKVSGFMARKLAMRGDNALKAKGLPVTDQNRYIMHFAGVGAGPKIIAAPDTDRVGKHMAPKQRSANKRIARMKVGDFKNKYVAPKFGKSSTPENTQIADNTGRIPQEVLQQMFQHPETRDAAMNYVLGEYQRRAKANAPMPPEKAADIDNVKSRTDLNRLKAQKLEQEILNPNQRKKLSATELKALYEAQDDLPNLKGTIENLERAKALLPETNTGFAPELRAYMGNVLHDYAMPDQLSSPESSKATAEYAQIMDQQAIEAMGRSLKGAMSNYEMQAFKKIIADTTLPHDVRVNAINRLIAAAERQMKVKQGRINELQGLPPEQMQQKQAQDPLGIR